MKLDRLILKKIIKIVATRCQILRLKCTKFDFGFGSAPDPAGEAYSASPDPLSGFQGPTSKGREEKGGGGEGSGREEKRGREVYGEPTSKGGEGGEREGRQSEREGKGEGMEREREGPPGTCLHPPDMKS